MKKINTVKIQGGAQYAKVSDRLKEFRSENPRASITTTPIPQDSGMVLFKAYILKDKADEHSADATGHALQIKAGTKDFEKLETVAVGRALALLGYGADGEIASSEEMEEFERFQDEKKFELIEKTKKEVAEITDVKKLREYYLANKGNGEEVAEIITNRSNELK